MIFYTYFQIIFIQVELFTVAHIINIEIHVYFFFNLIYCFQYLLLNLEFGDKTKRSDF